MVDDCCGLYYYIHPSYHWIIVVGAVSPPCRRWVHHRCLLQSLWAAVRTNQKPWLSVGTGLAADSAGDVDFWQKKMRHVDDLIISLKIFAYTYIYIYTGWWFGTFFIFPYIGNSNPNWLIFFRGVETTNQYTYHVETFCNGIFCVEFQALDFGVATQPSMAASGITPKHSQFPNFLVQGEANDSDELVK